MTTFLHNSYYGSAHPEGIIFFKLSVCLCVRKYITYARTCLRARAEAFSDRSAVDFSLSFCKRFQKLNENVTVFESSERMTSMFNRLCWTTGWCACKCLLDRNNCSKTPAICHEKATCSLVSPEVCVSERPFNYRCVCDPGYSGDGEDCQGEMTLSHCTHSCSQDFFCISRPRPRETLAPMSRDRDRDLYE